MDHIEGRIFYSVPCFCTLYLLF